MNANIKQTNTQCLEISLDKLPISCAMRERCKSWVNSLRATVYVVAKADYSDTWVAYIGYPSLSDVKSDLKNQPFVDYHCTNMHDPENVLAYGDVLDKESAEILFPEWSYRRYRT